ncbi:MAG: hypothetical protein L0Z49_13820 [Actinobacteria bacterium]|nr:hypothetical protein [Actinomycetota bacterium]
MRRITYVMSVVVMLLTALPAFAGGNSALAEARQGTADFHDVGKAETAGYMSTLDILGCFENPGVGGMGLHYVNFGIVDGTVDAGSPEALVYEMRSNGKLKLVGHEYLVPSELVDPTNPPELFGHEFHPHPVLPFWILHAWVWSPNPDGVFADWNPRVGMCPDGVPVFGE